MSKKMVAITGNSGSGKSTVSDFYRSLGFEVCDADKVAYSLLQEQNMIVQQLADHFGQDIFDEQGFLNRKLLANRAFATEEGTKRLTEITYPAILEQILQQWTQSKNKIFFVDGAVIIGHPLQDYCDKIVLVQTEQQQAIERICKRDGISEQMALRRLKAQPKAEILEKAADYVLVNQGNLEQLQQQAKVVLSKLIDEDFV